MSRHNKVNPGQYTQRGRLTPDDSARELVRQRTAIASQDKYQGRPGAGPWQGATGTPVNDDNDDNEEPAGQEEEASAPEAKPRKTARTATKTGGATKSAGGPKKAPEKQARKSVAKTAAKTAATTAAKRSAAKSGGATGQPPRKAALARSAAKRKKTARR